MKTSQACPCFMYYLFGFMVAPYVFDNQALKQKWQTSRSWHISKVS